MASVISTPPVVIGVPGIHAGDVTLSEQVPLQSRNRIGHVHGAIVAAVAAAEGTPFANLERPRRTSVALLEVGSELGTVGIGIAGIDDPRPQDLHSPVVRPGGEALRAPRPDGDRPVDHRRSEIIGRCHLDPVQAPGGRQPLERRDASHRHAIPRGEE